MRAWITGVLGLCIVGCSTVTTTQPGTVGVDRKQTMSHLVSEAQLQQGAAQAYQQLLGEARQKGVLNRDSQQVRRVRDISNRIVGHVQVFRPDASSWPWEMNVIDSDQVNAWAMPGGKMAVYSGLVEKLNLTDAELAAVIGHEIAHSLREHGRERASRAVTQNLALSAVGALSQIGGDALQLAQLAMEVSFNLPNSREQETEADRIGVELAARAGYDPKAAITLWQKMANAGTGSGPKWLSTHPPREERMRDLAEYATKVMPLYIQARV